MIQCTTEEEKTMYHQHLLNRLRNISCMPQRDKITKINVNYMFKKNQNGDRGAK